MPQAPYPLEPVEDLRTQARDAAAVELAAASARLRAAQDALTAAQAVLEGAQQTRASFVREAGTRSDGAALQREARYATRLQQELEAAARGMQQAETMLDARRRERALAQDLLARAEAERAALARDHACHDAEGRRRRAQAEELEQEDNQLGRSPRGPGIESLHRSRGLPRR